MSTDQDNPALIMLHVQNLQKEMSEMRKDMKPIAEVIPRLIERLELLTKNVQEDTITLNTTLKIHMDDTVRFRDSLRERQIKLETDFTGFSNRLQGAFAGIKQSVSIALAVMTIIFGALYALTLYTLQQKIQDIEKLQNTTQVQAIKIVELEGKLNAINITLTASRH